MEISDLLARNFLFRNLDPDVIERISALGTRVELAGNLVLFLKGDEGDALYGVLDGRIRISSGDADGKEIILNIIDSGDIFGEIALLDGKPRTADASAMAASQLFRVQRSDFLGLMAAEPRLTQHLLLSGDLLPYRFLLGHPCKSPLDLPVSSAVGLAKADERLFPSCGGASQALQFRLRASQLALYVLSEISQLVLRVSQGTGGGAHKGHRTT